MSLINVNAKDAAFKLSVFRSHFIEVAVIALALVVSYLFNEQRKMSNDMTKYLLTDRKEMIQVLQQNNQALQENNQFLKSVKHNN